VQIQQDTTKERLNKEKQRDGYVQALFRELVCDLQISIHRTPGGDRTRPQVIEVAPIGDTDIRSYYCRVGWLNEGVMHAPIFRGSTFQVSRTRSCSVHLEIFEI
jgi:hypothetical protein